MGMLSTIRGWFGRGKPARSGKRAFYSGASMSRLMEWVMRPTTEDQAIKADLEAARARARDLARNNPYVRQYLKQVAVNVIGPEGIKLQGRVRNNNGQLALQINEKIEDAWEEWAEAVTVDGKQSLAEFERLAKTCEERDGEAFVRFVIDPSINRFGLALLLVDPALVDHTLNVSPTSQGGNEIRMGVELDGMGRPVAYHLWTTYGSNDVYRERVRIPATEMLHLFTPEFAGQTRAVTKLNSVLAGLRHLDGFVEATLVAKRIGAAKMGWWVRRPGQGGVENDAPVLESTHTMDVEPGTFGIGPDGYELQDWNPDAGGADFPGFVKAALRTIATGLGVAYNSFANDLEGVNYSSIRTGMLTERDRWRAEQRAWISMFRRPLYRTWLEISMLTGALVLDSRDFRKFLTVKHVPRGWAWVDPQKDVAAIRDAIAAGLDTHTRALAEKGEDVEETFEQLAEERELAKQLNLDMPELFAGVSKSAGSAPAAGASASGTDTTGGKDNAAA